MTKILQSNDQYTVRVFKADSDQSACEIYFEHHYKALNDYGINDVYTLNKRWFTASQVYCVVLEDRQKNMIGGIRLHIDQENGTLPLLDELYKIDNGACSFVPSLKSHGKIGEACGMWVIPEARGQKLSTLLINSITYLADQLDVKNIIGFSSEHSLKLLLPCGYKKLNILGVNGKFEYPCGYHSYLVHLKVERLENVELSSALSKNRSRYALHITEVVE